MVCLRPRDALGDWDSLVVGGEKMGVWLASFFLGSLNYFIVYKWILRVQFQKKIGVILGVMGGACLLIMALYLSGKFHYTGPAITVVAICALLSLVKEKRGPALLLCPMAIFVTGAVNILGSYLLSYAIKMSYGDFMDSNAWGLVMQGCFPLLFFFLFPFIKGLHEDGEMIKFNVAQYAIAFLGTGCLFSVIAISQGVMLGKTLFSDWPRMVSISLVIVGIIFIGLIFWESHIEKRALQYKMENEYYQLALKRQETHIKEIVESDQKIRRFRHDVNAHLTALEQCIQTNDMQQLKSYVERMRAETRKYEVQKYTGVGAVDAIISEWHQKALEEGIGWEWEGGFLGQTEIETFDLCVIFSNLLSNAVEAVRKMEDGREKKIQISCGTFRGRFCIRISNTCRLDLESKSHYNTTKNDFKNHGFGLMNIQNTVEKIHGEFHKSVENGVFSAEILV